MAKKPFIPVVAVLNMKGGVGKTTISANVFRVLFERRKVSTLLIDLDPQFNLTQTLFRREQYAKIKSGKKTISQVFNTAGPFDLLAVKASAMPVPEPKQLEHTFLVFSGEKTRLSLISGDFDLVKYSLMTDEKELERARKRFVEFVDKAKVEFDLICIDCNPSSSFITLCALQACTHVLVPVRADRYSILGLEILSRFIDSVPSISPKPEILVVLNGTPNARSLAVAAVERELRGHVDFGARTLATEIRESGLLKAKTDYTGFATDRKVSWSNRLNANINQVADELAGKLGL